MADDPFASLDAAQVDGLTDLDPAAFGAAAREVVAIIEAYLAGIEQRSVLPQVEPGTIARSFPTEPPAAPEPLRAILDDYLRLIEPNATHWQHPGFMAYFPTSGSAAGILGEMLMAGLGQNAMLWRTSPIGTELEQVVVGWLRDALGLPAAFDGFLTDTASTSSLIALGAAREAGGLRAAELGLAGRPELGPPRIYASTETHSSIDKAAMTLGLGRASVVRLPPDRAYAMRPDLLRAAIAADRSAGRQPLAVVATIGTTASTAIDPVAEIAQIARGEGLWLHVDAAYAGVVALLPDLRGPFAGWELADSIVVNPHKWLFTPLDASLLLTRRMPALREAFSLVPEYLRTLDRDEPTRDITEYTPQLGRRFRALKLWLLLRWFGIEGLQRRIAAHLDQAAWLADVVRAEPGWELLAPVPFATLCIRHRPEGVVDATPGGGEDSARIDAHNQAILEAVNRSGAVFLSHTRLDGRFAIRVALGHLRTEARHVEHAWALLRQAASDAPA
jgi:aromatic-L-amino-acid decarboxylase